jgi:hypothetical protein
MKPLPVLVAPFVLFAGCARHSGDIAVVGPSKTPRFETRSEVATNSSSHADYVVADLDGDTILDMAVISVTGELRILLGNGTTFAVVQETSVGGLPLWMANGDFDRDGDQDLVILRAAANTSDVWFNDGNAGFTQGPTLGVPANPLAVTVGDLNNDTFLDIAVSVPAIHKDMQL